MPASGECTDKKGRSFSNKTHAATDGVDVDRMSHVLLFGANKGWMYASWRETT